MSDKKKKGLKIKIIDSKKSNKENNSKTNKKNKPKVKIALKDTKKEKIPEDNAKEKKQPLSQEEIDKNNIKKRAKVYEYLKKLFPFTDKIIIGSICAQVFLNIIFLATRFSSILFLCLFCIVPWFCFVFTKDFNGEEEKPKKKTLSLLKINTYFTFLAFTNFIILLVSKVLSMKHQTGIVSNVDTASTITGISNVNPANSASVLVIFTFLAYFLITFVYIFFLKLNNITELFDELIEKNHLEEWNICEEEKEGDGDIILCQRADNDQYIRIPYTDRFLHMLIIGPTGCGKTSQIITPMLDQDVKNLGAGVTVIEPKGDLAEKVYALAQYYGRKAIYFNPILEACPSFNPLYGKEEDVIENIVTTFKMLDPDAKQYFQDMNEQLLRNALKILKRYKKNNATLLDLNTLISNPAGEGRLIVNKFMKIPAANEAEQKENLDCATYFLESYFNEKSKTYENCSGVRSQVYKITSNKFLRKVLNPTDGKSGLNFEKHLEEGGVLCITTAQGKLRDLGSFLGYFIILSFQSAVFKRPGNEDTRRPHFLYIDEFQKYSNPGFADMLTQGRSYRVASHLATQARAQIGMGSGKDGNAFITLVSTNCRNIVVFPGVSYDDAKYYSEQFGEELTKKKIVGRSLKDVNPLKGGFQKVGYDGLSEKIEEKYEARFTPTDIIYRKAKEITFLYIKNMVVQPPLAGKVNYIPWELNKRLNRMIVENDNLMQYGLDPNNCRLLDEKDAPLKQEYEEQIEEIIEFNKEKERREFEGEPEKEAETVKTSDDDISFEENKTDEKIDPYAMVQMSDNPDAQTKTVEYSKETGIQIDDEVEKKTTDRIEIGGDDDI